MPLRNSPYLPLLLAGVSTLAPFAIDTYLPAFHVLETALNASPLQLQQTLSAYLFAFAIMLLFHGALSDAYGRRKVVLVNLVLFSLASVGCALSPNIHVFILFRLLQGCSGGAGLVVGRAIIRDLHEGPAAQRVMSQVTLWFSLAPAIAPMIGGFLQANLGWKAIFWFMAAVGAVLFALCHPMLPETMPLEGRQVFRPRPLLRAYFQVLGDRRFLLLSLAMAANFSGFFLYIASAPAFVGTLLHQPETRYAWLFVPGIAGVSAGAWLSGRVARHWHAVRTVQTGCAVMLLAAAVNLLGNFWHAPELPWAVIPIMVYTTGMALVTPTLTLLMLEFFPAIRGMTASLQNFVATMLNAVVAGLVSPVLSVSGVGLASGMAVLAVTGAGGIAAYYLLPLRRDIPQSR